MSRKLAGLLGIAAVVVVHVACHHDHEDAAGPPGSVAGPLDAHCGAKVVTIDPALCASAPAGDGGVSGKSIGIRHDEAPVDPNTRYNAEADDDDCKYRMKWTSTAVAQGADVSFELTLTAKAGGAPVKGAPVRLEVFLDDTHPGPNTKQVSTEKSPGVYAVGPVRFDASGRWTVRFHVNDQCADSAASPHGHAAFFVQVP